jgi:phage major head subunit gpT-like protein
VKGQLRKILGGLSENPESLGKHLPLQLRSSVGSIVGLRDNATGAKLTDARRDELLEKCRAGHYVEVEVEILAYEQKAGERNRNSVRFRDGEMVALGRTGEGTPFLRDHRQGDSTAKGGIIIASATEKRGEGDYCIRQTVKLTEPAAVERALRGLLDAVSIGWRPTGPVLCSAHNAPVYTKCFCWPGDRLVEKDDDNGGKRKVRHADGNIVVEWIYTKAELVETSEVPIGGVPQARAGEVRAALFASLSASNPGLDLVDDLDEPDNEEGQADMKHRAALIAILGLAATSSDDEILAAIEAKNKEGAADKTELEIVKSDLKSFRTEIEGLKADRAKHAQDAFIAAALASGRIGKGDEGPWRALFQLDQKRAETEMSARKEGSATPVGLPRQSGGADPDDVDVDTDEDDDEPAPRQSARPSITGGGVPGWNLELVGERSKTETRELRTQLARAVKRLETHSDPKARLWAKRFGYEGKLKNVATTLSGTTISNNADLDGARVGFHAAFLQQLEQAAVDPAEMLYTTVPSTGNLETWNWMGDLPGFEEWVGDRKMSGLEGFKLDVANKKWSNGLRLKNDDIKDDKLGLLAPQIQGLATKARRHRLDLMLKNLLNGFDGDNYPTVSNGLGYDGAFFFADTHKGGNDNKMTVALDAAGLTAAELLLESMTTYDGNDPLDVHGTTLIVGPKLRATAEKLLTQERLANGEDNYHRGKYKLLVSNRIRGTEDDYWFLADLSQPIRPFLFQMREEISTSALAGQDGNNSMPGFQRDESWFGAQARYNVAYFEFRLIVGSVVA